MRLSKAKQATVKLLAMPLQQFLRDNLHESDTQRRLVITKTDVYISKKEELQLVNE